MHIFLPRRKNIQTALVSVLTFGSLLGADVLAQEKTAAVPPPVPAANAAEANRNTAETKVISEGRELSADELFKIVREQYVSRNYKEAIRLALQVNDLLRAGRDIETLPEETRKKLDENRKLIGKAYCARAEELFHEAEKSADAGDYDQAVELSNKAIENYPPCKEIMEQMIAKYTRLKEAAEFSADTSMAKIDPDGKDRSLRIEKEIRKGQQYYRTKQWAKARDKFNDVLALDPYNEQAIDYLKRCYQMLIKVAEMRQKVVEQERGAEVLWKGITPIISTVESPEDFAGPSAVDKVDETKNIEGKLKEIKFTQLEFEDQPLKEVLATLRKRSEELDIIDKNGVNIILLTKKSTPAPSNEESSDEESSDEESSDEESSDEESSDEESSDEESSDEESSDEEWEDSGVADEGGKGDHMIDYLKVDNVDMRQAIHLICDAAGVRYRIEPHAVLIADNDVPLDEYDLKVFVVEKEALELIGGGEEGVDGSSAVKQFFIDRGVTFPPGTAIKFDEAVSRLIVTNTPEALQEIDGIIQEMNMIDPQVLVRVKFVEVDLNDLEELGFEYVVSRTTNGKTSGSETIIAPGTYMADESFTLVYKKNYQNQETVLNGVTLKKPTTGQTNAENKVIVDKNSVYTIPESADAAYYSAPLNQTSIYGSSVTFGANSQLVRNAQQDPTLFGTAGTVANDTVMTWSHSSKQGYDTGMKIHAIDQADSADVLSAPRVTTMNMQPAVIKMVVNKYYPDSWGEATLETMSVNSGNGNGNNSIPVFQPSIPEFGDAVEEGIVLNVRPEVEDLFTITLEMTPVIQNFVDWSDYSYEIPLGDNGDYYPNTLKMPIIEARTVETTVVSFDGETIVLGGIIRDRVSVVEDQYPILGDIPLVGRLFQSKGRGSAKTNLLIFLTSRLIKPDGSPIR